MISAASDVEQQFLASLPLVERIIAIQARRHALSASDAEEFGAWLDTVRGDTDVVVSEHRPVPLWQHVMVGSDLFDLFAGDIAFDESVPESGTGSSRAYEVNPELLKLASAEHKLNWRAPPPAPLSRSPNGAGSTPKAAARPSGSPLSDSKRSEERPRHAAPATNRIAF